MGLTIEEFKKLGKIGRDLYGEKFPVGVTSNGDYRFHKVANGSWTELHLNPHGIPQSIIKSDGEYDEDPIWNQVRISEGIAWKKVYVKKQTLHTPASLVEKQLELIDKDKYKN